MKTMALAGSAFFALLIFGRTLAGDIYQWMDANGVANFGSQPPAGSHAVKIGVMSPSPVAAQNDNAARNLRAAKIMNATRAPRTGSGYSKSGISGVDQQRLNQLNREIDFEASSRIGDNRAKLRNLLNERAAILTRYRR